MVAILLNLIGPVLSYYSLKQIGCENILLYSVWTYLLDLISVLIFAFVLAKFTSFKNAFRYSVLIYIPNWFFDIFDISQALRPLSVMWFGISLIILWYILFNYLKLENKKVLVILFIVYIVLYLVDSLIAETLCSNVYLKNLIFIR